MQRHINSFLPSCDNNVGKLTDRLMTMHSTMKKRLQTIMQLQSSRQIKIRLLSSLKQELRTNLHEQMIAKHISSALTSTESTESTMNETCNASVHPNPPAAKKQLVSGVGSSVALDYQQEQVKGYLKSISRFLHRRQQLTQQHYQLQSVHQNSPGRRQAVNAELKRLLLSFRQLSATVRGLSVSFGDLTKVMRVQYVLKKEQSRKTKTSFGSDKYLNKKQGLTVRVQMNDENNNQILVNQ